MDGKFIDHEVILSGMMGGKLNIQQELQSGSALVHIIGLFFCIGLWSPKHLPFVFLLWAIYLVILGIRKQLQFTWKNPSLFWVVFYLAYAVGCLFTQDQVQANKYLEYKAIMLVVPALFLVIPKERLDIKRIKGWFIFAVTLLVLWECIRASMSGIRFENLTSSRLSIIHHPTYFGFFTFTAALFLWEFLKDESDNKWLLRVGIGFMLIMTIASFSMGMLLALICLFLVLFLVWLKKKTNALVMFLSLFILPFVLHIFLSETPRVKDEWFGITYYLGDFIENPEAFVRNRKYPLTGTETRMAMWTASWQVLEEHPLGVGTGNVDIYLAQKLRELNRPVLAERMYNPHNQYLQIAIEIGWIPCLLLVAFLFYLGRIFVRKKEYALLIFIACFAFNCLFESMLQRQSGLFLFVMWTSIPLYWLSVKNEESINRHTLS